jgi:hypothetical protein
MSLDNAIKLASVIFVHGYSYLSDSEQFVLQTDEQLRRVVFSLVDIYKRSQMLETTEGTTDEKSVNPFSNVSKVDIIRTWVWNEDETTRRAVLYQSMKTKLALIEIREWIREDLKSDRVGSHSILKQEVLQEKDKDLLIEKCKTILHPYGFNEEKGFSQ